MTMHDIHISKARQMVVAAAHARALGLRSVAAGCLIIAAEHRRQASATSRRQ